MTDNALEKRMHNDIHKIAVSLEKIEQHLSTIAKSYEPITFDMGETSMSFNAEHVDDGK